MNSFVFQRVTPCQSRSTLRRLSNFAQLPLQGGADPAGSVEPKRDLANMLRGNFQLSGHSAEKAIKSRCLGKLGRDTFKVIGQVEPQNYATNHIPDRIFKSRDFLVTKDKNRNSLLARRIANLRRGLGHGNQTEFAQRLGTDQGTVSKWEAGRSRPIPEMLVRMASLAADAEKLYFLEEAGLPPEFLDGKDMFPELHAASAAIVARSLSEKGHQTDARNYSWDPELLVFVIETVDAELRKRGRKLAIGKFAEMVVLFYEFCHSTGRRDSGMVERFLKIA